MGWLTYLKNARWFPYAAIGAVIFVSGVFGFGYMRGYNSAEDKLQKAQKEALEKQMDKLSKLHKIDLKLALNLQEKINDIKKNMESGASLPSDIPIECVRIFNDGVQAAGVDTE